jgi:hypothetical protein
MYVGCILVLIVLAAILLPAWFRRRRTEPEAAAVPVQGE